MTLLDIPGAGPFHHSPSPLSVALMVEEIRRVYLRNERGEEEKILVAISLGGMIAAEWMNLHPKDFDKGVFINTSYGGISPFYQRLRLDALLFLLKVPLLKGRKKEERILRLVSNNPEVFAATLDLWDKIQRERPVSLKNALRQLTAAAKFKIGDWKPTVPVFLLASTRDRMVSVECSRAIAKKWGLPLEEHPSAGHDLSVDDPQWIILKMRSFLGS